MRLKNCFAIAIGSLLVAGCSTLSINSPENKANSEPEVLVSAGAASDCQILYDAGSSGTRLYIYQKTGENWAEHEGPKVSALADPIRGTRGKTFSDVEAVEGEVSGALTDMLSDGPLEDGEPMWAGFDWKNDCNIVAASVFATAGMRIAEQLERDKSAQTWSKLKSSLQTLVGEDVPVQARTLSGFEEGLFAWLALAQREDRTDFGIAEMGGASAQVVYPCEDCDTSTNAVRTVSVNGVDKQMYSYSFLGLGTDEAYRTLGFPMACRYGIGEIAQNWSPQQCSDKIELTRGDDDAGYTEVYDPYNYVSPEYGGTAPLPTAEANLDEWFLTGAFAFMSDSDLDDYCYQKNGSFDAENGCFRAVYLRKYLETLGLEEQPTSRSSWTLGAALCEAEDCLAPAKPEPICRWSSEGCLSDT